MKVLIDMDGVIADFERGFLEQWRDRHPDKIFIPLDQRDSFYVVDQYPDELRDLVYQIYHSPNFYRSLQPIQGSIKALLEETDVLLYKGPRQNNISNSKPREEGDQLLQELLANDNTRKKSLNNKRYALLPKILEPLNR